MKNSKMRFPSAVGFCLSLLAMILSCQLNDDKNSDIILLTVEADSTYFRFGKLWVAFVDMSGKDTTVLWEADSLAALDKLRKIPIGIPPGQVIRVIIRGYQSGSGKLIYEEIRSIDLSTGNLIGTSTPLDLTKAGLRSPVVKLTFRDTVVSIKDTLAFSAVVTDSDGIVFSFSWDLDGNEKFGSEFAYFGDSDTLKNFRPFADSGRFSVVVRIRDASRKTYFDTLRVTVLQDVPRAEAGEDVSVMVLDSVRLHGKGEDKLGKIVGFEWKTIDGVFSKSQNGDTSFLTSQKEMDQIWILRVTDDDGNQAEDTVKVVATFHSDAFLSDLSITGFELKPPFERGRFSYSLQCPYTTDSAEINLKAEDPEARVSVSGAEWNKGVTRGMVPLQVGGNRIEIVVKAQNGVDSKSYSLFIQRNKNNDAALSNLSISPGMLSPKFSGDSMDYTITLENGENLLALTPFASDPLNAKVTVGDSPRISGLAGNPIPIPIGIDTIKVMVVAHDDTTKRIYRVIVSRLPSSDATLNNIQLSVGALSPSFSPKVVRYSVTLANVISEISVNPILGSQGSRIFLNDSLVAAGTFSKQHSLSVGNNLLKFTIIAENGDTGVYEIAIRRKSNNADLGMLRLSAGYLRPEFSPGTTNYTDTINGEVDSVEIFASVADSESKQIIVGEIQYYSTTVTKTVPITFGSNQISVDVISEDGLTKRYSLLIYRKNRDATLKGIETSIGLLAPPFSIDQKQYLINVENSQSEIIFKPIPNNTHTSVFLGEEKIEGGENTGKLDLETGDTDFKFRVKSENGDSSLYTIKVHRRSVNSSLKMLAVDNESLRPGFLPSVLNYRDTVPPGVKSLLITAAAEDKFVRSIAINGVQTQGDRAEISIPLGGLLFPVYVKLIVTAEEGNETLYEIKITGPGFIKKIGTKDDDNASNIIQTNDGGYLFSEFISSSIYGLNSVLFKLNSDGDTVWTRSLIDQFAMAGQVLESSSKEFIVSGTGYKPGGEDPDVFLCAYDKIGNVLWSKFIGSPSLAESGLSIIQSKDGGFVIAGSQTTIMGEQYDAYVVKTTGSGDSVWTKTIGIPTENEHISSIVQLDDGGFLISGRTSNPGSNASRTLLIKLDASGNLVWKRSYSGGSSSRGSDLAIDADGGFLIAGNVQTGGASGSDAMVFKTTENGDSLWLKSFGSTFDDGFSSIKKTKSGGFVLAGFSGKSNTNLDAYLVTTDASFVLKWEKAYGGDNEDYALDVTQEATGGFILSGSTSSFGALKKDCLIIKTNSNGEVE